MRDLLGDGDDAKLSEANAVVNQALQLRPDEVEAWLLKCQIASAMGDDHALIHNHRIGRERYWGHWRARAGSNGAPSRVDGQPQTTLATLP